LINELLTLHDAAIKSNVIRLTDEIRHETGVISSNIPCLTLLFSRGQYEHFVHGIFMILNAERTLAARMKVYVCVTVYLTVSFRVYRDFKKSL
jgi:hypothetical protein